MDVWWGESVSNHVGPFSATGLDPAERNQLHSLRRHGRGISVTYVSQWQGVTSQSSKKSSSDAPQFQQGDWVMPHSAQSAGYEIYNALVIKAQPGSIWHLRMKNFSLHFLFWPRGFSFSAYWRGSLYKPEDKSDIETCQKPVLRGLLQILDGVHFLHCNF